MDNKVKKLGIIAGAGRVPALAFMQARAAGCEPLLVALKETGAPEDLKAAGAPFTSISMGQPQKVIDLLRQAGVDEVLIVGKVPKQLHFEKIEFDERALVVLGRMQSRSDMDLFAALAEEFLAEGLPIVGQSNYLSDYLVSPGLLCGPGFPEEEQKQAQAALDLARRIADLDIGQTVVFKKGAVVAVEAFEHTDQTIRRAGELAGEGLWVAKAARPNQDDRFDVPAVGQKTVEVMGEVGAKLLLVEAGKIFLFDQDQTVSVADRFDISIVAM